MQYIVAVLIFTVVYLIDVSASIRIFHNAPGDWTLPSVIHWYDSLATSAVPTAPPLPPLEEVHYSVVSPPLALGSALYWDTAANVLYFADVTGQTLYRYDPANDLEMENSITFNAPVSMVIPLKGEKHHLVVGVGKEMTLMKWNWATSNYSTSHLFSVSTQKPTNIWSVGRADSLGRIWAEAVNNDQVNISSRLYVVDTINSCRADSLISDQATSQGLVWSLDNKKLYISSSSGKIKAFDFDINSGLLSNSRTFFDFSDFEYLQGSPAGLAIDKDGNLWVSCYGDSQVIQVDSYGTPLRRIKLPVSKVTGVVFGGPTLSDLYVTSAGGTSHLDGSVLRITDIKETGVPMYSANILCKPCNDEMDANSSSWWCAATNF